MESGSNQKIVKLLMGRWDGSVPPGQHPVKLQSAKFKNTKYLTFLKICVIHQNKA